MRVQIKKLLFCGAMSLSFGVFSPAYAQGLAESVLFALENHPSVVGAQAAYDAAGEGVDVEKAGYYPTVSLGGTVGRVYQDNSTSRGLSVTRGSAYSNMGEGNVALRQTLFDGAETRSRVLSARARQDSSGHNVSDIKGVISLRVAQSYTDILRLRKALSLLADQLASIKDYEHRIAEMVEDGAADEAEIQQAKDVSMMVESMRIDYEGQLVAAEAAYLEASAHMFPENAPEYPVSLSGYIEPAVADAISQAKEGHPILLAAASDARAAEYDVRVERAQLLPDINGEVSYLQSDKRDVVGGEAKDARAVVRMNWDFSTGGRYISALKQKKYAQQEAEAGYKALERQIERDIYQAYANYSTLQRKAEISRKRVALNEALLESYKVQFEAARIGLLSLMRTESQLFTARLEESDSRYNLLSAEYNILSVLGRLTDSLLPHMQGEENVFAAAPSDVVEVEPAAGDDGGADISGEGISDHEEE